MFTHCLQLLLYGVIVLSLFLVDYALGNGFIDVFQRVACKFLCFIKKSIREEETKVDVTQLVRPISLPMLFTEILILTLTIAFLKKYNEVRGRDRIDKLLQESKEALRQTNEFLEKWRLRRIIWQEPTKYDYLDDEPQEIKPLKLEVPILHMAIIDTRGASRNQLERGDAGDSLNFSESAVLSVTSLEDEDDVMSNHMSSSEEKVIQDRRGDFNNRYLWDVMEEDSAILNES